MHTRTCARCAGTAGTSSAATCAPPRITRTAWARTSSTSPRAATGPAHTTAARRAAGARRRLEGYCSGVARASVRGVRTTCRQSTRFWASGPCTRRWGRTIPATRAL